MPGISGLSVYVPPYRVNLENWCEWTGQPWGKIRQVIGHGFRMRGVEHDAYTMAATAVVRLIAAYEIDPQTVGYLAFGTESSSDNAAGAVIVKGLVDAWLVDRGLAPLARDCEVPEYKHACLGGIYALKGGLRYLAGDGQGRRAIAVCADIAEYARGSSGEPTQGAGAVAMLLDTQPQILEVDLSATGSSSAYRVLDFRKPFSRFPGQAARANGQVQDAPVFNGHYSTTCYVDAVHQAVAAMARRGNGGLLDNLESLDAVFMHRPYHRMPATAWGMVWLFALAADAPQQLDALAGDAGLDTTALRRELAAQPPFAEMLADGARIEEEQYPLAMQLLRFLRKHEWQQRCIAKPMQLGSQTMMELGNLYTAALPAWLAAGLEQASGEPGDIAGQRWLAVGYGSGDAAEALPLRPVPGWRTAAARVVCSQALDNSVDLSAEQYAALHAGRHPAGLSHRPADEFVIESVGAGECAEYDDTGVAFHRYAQAGAV